MRYKLSRREERSIYRRKKNARGAHLCGSSYIYYVLKDVGSNSALAGTAHTATGRRDDCPGGYPRRARSPGTKSGLHTQHSLTHASVYTTIIACAAAGVVTGAAGRDRQLALSLPRELLQDTPPLAAAGLIANSI